MAYKKYQSRNRSVNIETEVLKSLLAKRQYIQRHVDVTGGGFFNVEFIKADGTKRRMTARTGVTQYVKGVGRNYTPKENHITVFDMNARSRNRDVRGDYRTLNTDKTLSFTYKGTVHTFTDHADGSTTVVRTPVIK